ncbi:NAD(P)H:quinone oxidoreductase [Thermodesulfovibrio yellowstonii]|uniref:Flavoprotein WrbA, protein n=1 Tax=Thermodesulfovibrio yellowstonii TaxID=28262 RepID=A0A9W6LJZ5_9BACT|nr:NAD(P)H:quinone oxidoreductase [Thermodesulfovibrio islandicus]GLI53716.1 flavoprotein WrbA, protein [Thermodesulfovibrio islandicus]
MKILIVYYSTFGNTYKMAQLIAEGIKEADGEPIIRRCPELIPENIIESRPDMKAGAEMQKDVPLVTLEDFKQADGYAFGTPTRFGNVSAQLKNVIDQLGPLWIQRVFEGKPAGVFVSTGTLHGGQETTILTFMTVLLHLGCIIVGVPYSVSDLYLTKGGGSPYGPGHIAEAENKREIDQNEANICKAFGRRLTDVAKRLKSS